MAEIILGAGTSHGPLLSTPPEYWDLRAKADRANKQHYFRGKAYDYDALLAERAPGFAQEIGLEIRRERDARSQRALDTLAAVFKVKAPAALVIVGNDQRELFNDSMTPAITVYRGDQIQNIPFNSEHVSPGLGIAEKGNCPPGGATYPGAPALADHIIRSLGAENFDLAQSSSLPKDVPRPGIPHAYGFVYNRVFANNPPPSVPVILNVHYPHNRPSLARCLALGRALQRAIRSWDGGDRVAMLASGGLSHYVIDEELDRAVLAAMAAGDEDALARLPEDRFQSGTAEIKNWLPIVAAMNAEGLRIHQLDYIPSYRSEAGTGNAMAFVYWD